MFRRVSRQFYSTALEFTFPPTRYAFRALNEFLG
jgi:hypothetical protein